MRRRSRLSPLFVLVAIALAATAAAVPAAVRSGDTAEEEFSRYFTGATMRLDLSHTGHAALEHVSLDRIRVEGPWPGSRTRLIDTTNRGKYLVEVVDPATNVVLYTRGFSTIYGEWETTGPARRGEVGTIQEAIRFPEPRAPVQIRLRKRTDDGTFVEIWSRLIDPASRAVDRAPVPEQTVRSIIDNGEPATKVDLLILGDGYTSAEIPAFHDDVARLVDALFGFEPFASRRADFSVRAVDTPVAESGISRPRAEIFRNTAFGLSYNAFDSERYMLTFEDRRWRDIAAAAPYEFVIMLANERKYGGGGIFGLYSTAAAGSSFSPYLVVHEFGHHFAGLGDEYYTSEVAYEDFTPPSVEPWEPNVTALLDPDRLKWGDLVAAETPLPTPWPKNEFEALMSSIQGRRAELRTRRAAEEELDALFQDERGQTTELLVAGDWDSAVGAFEGAAYEARGLYRPQADCIMFTRSEAGYCEVCSRAIQQIIDLYAR